MRCPRFLAAMAALVLLAAPSFAGHLNVYQGTFELDGAQEVPRVNSPFRGNCAAVLDGLMLTLSCTTDAAGIVAAHIHSGFAGTSGPVEIPLTAGRIIFYQGVLSDQQAALAVLDGLYVNIHTPDHPAGEVRGQFHLNTVESSNSLIIHGDGSEAVPTTTSDAWVACRIFTANEADKQLRAVCAHDVENPAAAHIHMGSPGETGNIVFPFDSPVSPIIQTFDLTDEQYQSVLDQDFYVNIHTQAFPAGEVRADFQGCQEDDHTLCLSNNRFAVTLDGVDPNTQASLEGVGRALSADSGTFSLFSADNKEVLVKVLDACSNFNRFFVFGAATTNVGFELTVTDTASGMSKVYSNPVGMLADPIADTSSFATCP